MSEDAAVYEAGPKTMAEARALPEVSCGLRFADKPTPLGGPGITGDTICWFVDADGRSMKVVATKCGFAKTPL